MRVVVIIFSVRIVSVLRGHSDFSSPPQRPMTSDFEGFLYQILSITSFSYLNSWERASIFPFQCWVLNKGTTGTIFITSLVWRGPWLRIEPGTSRTRCQHSTTRLSRRRYIQVCWCVLAGVSCAFSRVQTSGMLYMRCTGIRIKHNEQLSWPSKMLGSIRWTFVLYSSQLNCMHTGNLLLSLFI